MIEFSEKTDREAGAEFVISSRILRRKRSVSPNDFDVTGDVSQDLTPDAGDRLSKIETIDDVFREISWLAQERFSPESEDGKNARLKIDSILTYGRAAERSQYFGFPEYIRRTLALGAGFVVKINGVPEEELKEQRNMAVQRFSNLGYDFTRFGWSRFQRENKIEEKDLRRVFEEARERLLPVMQQAFGVDFIPNYRIAIERKDEYWLNWVSGSTDGFLQRINSHERHEGRRVNGVEERLTCHEVTHMFQMHSLMLNIRNGKVNPFYGITTTPGIEQWNSESLADTITRFLPEIYNVLSDFGKFAVEYEAYRQWVYRDAHILLNTWEPKDWRIIRERILDELPSESEHILEKEIEDRTSNPKNRAYRFAYAGSFEHTQIAKMLYHIISYYDKRREFVDYCFFRPRTPDEVIIKARELENQMSVSKVSFSQKLKGFLGINRLGGKGGQDTEYSTLSSQ